MLIELESVRKIYNQGQVNEVVALDDISLQVEERNMVCLRGASGCGKSTLLSIIGCVFQPTSGLVAIAGKKLSRLPDRFLTLHRRRFIGFIFQNFNILTSLTVRENIVLPLVPLGITPAKMKERADKLMQRFDIYHRETTFAYSLNLLGGQFHDGNIIADSATGYSKEIQQITLVA